MSLSVFEFSYRPSYYLTHPIKFFKEICINLQDAYRRAKYGWAPRDAYNLGFWLQEILPPMLRVLAEDEIKSYPGRVCGNYDFTTYENWVDWLHSVADVIESTQELNWDGQNEFEKEWRADRKNCSDELRHKYWSRELELETQRKALQHNAFIQLIDNLEDLWS